MRISDRGHLRTCTYKEFMNFKPKPFYRNEGVVELTHWIKKMESVFEISFYAKDCKVRFSSFTFEDTTLSWWNKHAKTMGIRMAKAISWDELKRLLMNEYCPRAEMQKSKQELQNDTLQDADIIAYTNRFNDFPISVLTLLPQGTRR